MPTLLAIFKRIPSIFRWAFVGLTVSIVSGCAPHAPQSPTIGIQPVELESLSDGYLEGLTGRLVCVRGTAGFVWPSNCAFVRLSGNIIFLDGFSEDWPDGINAKTPVLAVGVLARRKILRDPIVDPSGNPISNGAYGEQWILDHPRWQTLETGANTGIKRYPMHLDFAARELEPMLGHLVEIEGIAERDPKTGVDYLAAGKRHHRVLLTGNRRCPDAAIGKPIVARGVLIQLQVDALSLNDSPIPVLALSVSSFSAWRKNSE